ncbi:hypothetical protein [Nocardioides sp. B-3]|uniref:hypothetical protein n=1 Tax=Nocardioides sp. B-3 TaxID=2895565 RepID=UPI0021534CC4|nr:hypothetical protein [Nocardioides sp. B-3]UUZ59219.1 hypothetical protein LP418_25495 [Nocardioides sp. B-3]
MSVRLMLAALAACTLTACGQGSMVAGWPSDPPPIVLQLADGTTKNLRGVDLLLRQRLCGRLPAGASLRHRQARPRRLLVPRGRLDLRGDVQRAR